MKYGKQAVSIRIPNAEGVKVTTEVGEAEFVICETVDEAIEKYGQERMLELLNAQAKTNAMNDYREKERVKRGLVEPSKNALKNEALKSVTSADMAAAMAAHPELPPMEAINLLVEERIAQLKRDRGMEDAD